MNTTTATIDDTAPRLKGASRQTLLKIGAAVLVIAGALLYGVHWWSVVRFVESTDDAYVGGDVTAIAAKVAGYITDVPVTDNQFVHAGELLVRIDARDYRAALAKASGAVDAQTATIANLRATSALQQSIIGRARAEIAVVDAEAVRAQADDTRYKGLVGRASVSVESAQRAEATYKAARANTLKAKAELQAAERQLEVIATQSQQAAAALEQAQAEREIAQLNLGYTELRAPIDGYVGNRRARVGLYAAAAAPLITLVPSQGLWIDANFKENQLAHMRAGQQVTIHADVLPGAPFRGRVDSLAPATGAQFSILPAENATGNFTKIVQRVPVRIHLDASDAQLGRLRPGLSVTVAVNTRATQMSQGHDDVAQSRPR